MSSSRAGRPHRVPIPTGSRLIIASRSSDPPPPTARAVPRAAGAADDDAAGWTSVGRRGGGGGGRGPGSSEGPQRSPWGRGVSFNHPALSFRPGGRAGPPSSGVLLSPGAAFAARAVAAAASSRARTKAAFLAATTPGKDELPRVCLPWLPPILSQFRLPLVSHTRYYDLSVPPPSDPTRHADIVQHLDLHPTEHGGRNLCLFNAVANFLAFRAGALGSSFGVAKLLPSSLLLRELTFNTLRDPHYAAPIALAMTAFRAAASVDVMPEFLHNTTYESALGTGNVWDQLMDLADPGHHDRLVYGPPDLPNASLPNGWGSADLTAAVALSMALRLPILILPPEPVDAAGNVLAGGGLSIVGGAHQPVLINPSIFSQLHTYVPPKRADRSHLSIITTAPLIRAAVGLQRRQLDPSVCILRFGRGAHYELFTLKDGASIPGDLLPLKDDVPLNAPSPAASPPAASDGAGPAGASLPVPPLGEPPPLLSEALPALASGLPPSPLLVGGNTPLPSKALLGASPAPPHLPRPAAPPLHPDGALAPLPAPSPEAPLAVPMEASPATAAPLLPVPLAAPSLLPVGAPSPASSPASAPALTAPLPAPSPEAPPAVPMAASPATAAPPLPASLAVPSLLPVGAPSPASSPASAPALTAPLPAASPAARGPSPLGALPLPRVEPGASSVLLSGTVSGAEKGESSEITSSDNDGDPDSALPTSQAHLIHCPAPCCNGFAFTSLTKALDHFRAPRTWPQHQPFARDFRLPKDSRRHLTLTHCPKCSRPFVRQSYAAKCCLRRDPPATTGRRTAGAASHGAAPRGDATAPLGGTLQPSPPPSAGGGSLPPHAPSAATGRGSDRDSAGDIMAPNGTAAPPGGAPSPPGPTPPAGLGGSSLPSRQGTQSLGRRATQSTGSGFGGGSQQPGYDYARCFAALADLDPRDIFARPCPQSVTSLPSVVHPFVSDLFIALTTAAQRNDDSTAAMCTGILVLTRVVFSTPSSDESGTRVRNTRTLSEIILDRLALFREGDFETLLQGAEDAFHSQARGRRTADSADGASPPLDLSVERGSVDTHVLSPGPSPSAEARTGAATEEAEPSGTAELPPVSAFLAEVLAGTAARPLQERSTAPNNSQGEALNGMPPLAPPRTKIIPAGPRAKRAGKSIDRGQIRRGVQILNQLAPVAAATPETLAALQALHPEAGEPISDAVLDFTGEGLPPPLPGGDDPDASPSEQARAERALRDALYKTLQNMRDKAPGPDGLRAHHVLQLIGVKEDPSRDYIRDAVLGFVRWIASGAHESARHSLVASTLIGIPKPQPGEIRPLAIGNIWRRTAAHLVVTTHRDAIETALGVPQIGFTRSGREAAVLAIRLKLEQHPDWVLYKIDMRNAFNEINRSLCLSVCLASVPQLVPFARLAYAFGADLWARQENGSSVPLASKEGTQQGCPAGSPLFGMGISEFLDESAIYLAGVCDDAIMVGDWDDVAFVAPAAIAAEMGRRTKEGALELTGLTMRPEKCYVWSPVDLSDEQRAAFPAGTRVASPDKGVIWSGIPFGREDYVVAQVRVKIVEHLQTIQDPVQAFGLLSGPQQYSALHLAISARPADLLRMLPPRLIAAAIQDFDDAMLKAFCSIIRTPVANLTPAQSLQIELPVKGSGFGLRRKVGIMNAAYVSAFLTAQGVIQRKWGPQLGDEVRNVGACDLPTALDVRQAYADVLSFDDDMPDAGRAQRLLEEALPDGLANLPADASKLAGMQRRLTEQIDAVNRLHVIEGSTLEERAWLESCSGPTAGAFLRARPGIVAPCTRMDSREFAISCQRRLFLTLPELALTSASNGICPALPAAGGRLCQGVCDARGAHLTTCPTGSGPTAIHDAVNDTLAVFGFQQVFPPHLVLFKRAKIRASLLQRYGLDGDVELPFPVPDIITLGEETLIIDTRITDPRGATNLAKGAGGAKGAGVSAELAAAKKRADYAPAFQGGFMQEANLKPFVMEHGGRLSKSADAVLYHLARLHEAKLTNLPPPEKLGPVGNRFLTFLRQIVSSALHKATSRRIIAVSDRVLFTKASRERDVDRSDFRLLAASDIAEAVGSFAGG